MVQEQLIGGNRLKQTNLQLNYGIISSTGIEYKRMPTISTHDEFNKKKGVFQVSIK